MPFHTESPGEKAMQTQSRLNTDAAAARLGIKPQTMRAALCRDGHYFGLRPIKQPNRMLMWPVDGIERLEAGERIEQPAKQAA
jgi:hypothetical protein